MYKISPLSIEEKLKDPYYKMMNDRANNTFNTIKPYALEDEEILNYFLMLKVNALLEEDKDPNKDIMTYFKYLLGEYVINKDENNELKTRLISQIKEAFDNDFLNICVFMYKTMVFTEAEDLLNIFTKYFYLIDKYKGTQFSINLLKWLNTINHYEDFKPKHTIDIKEIKDEEEKEKAYKSETTYLTLSLNNMKLSSLFMDYLQENKFCKDTITKNAETCLIDKHYLYNYSIILETEDYKDEEVLKPLKIFFSGYVKDAKNLYELKEDLKDFLESEAKDHNIDITLSEEEQQIIKNKIDNAKSILGKYNYKYHEYINFNTYAYLLAFNDLPIEWLIDPSTKLNIKDLEEKKGKKKRITNNNDSETREKSEIVNTKPYKVKPNKATKEELEARYKKREKEFYKMGSLPTNTNIINTYGALGSLETNNKEKLELKKHDLEEALKKAKSDDDKERYKGELELLQNKIITIKKAEDDLLREISEKRNNLNQVKSQLQAQEIEQKITNAEKEQYNTLIKSLSMDLMEAEQNLATINNKGIVFRGNLFNELEYIDDKGRIITSLRKSNGEVLNPKEVPTLTEAFLRISNDLYYNRLDNYNEFIDKVDLLFPKNKGINYKLANETIKQNLGKNGFIIDLKELLKILNVSEENIKYYSKNVSEAIKFLYNVEISIKQEDRFLKDKDGLNMFFGITNNVSMSRQVNNNVYIYYEISSIYLTILENGASPLISQTPTLLLKYATGQDGNKRVFKLGDYLFSNLRNSLNNSSNGVKIDKDGHYYKNYKIGTLLNHLRKSGLIKVEARPRKYREDIFNNFVKALDTLEKEGLIKYSLLYDDSVAMTNETFKNTFEASMVEITFIKVSEDYEAILSKNISNKKSANITNASKFTLNFGKYEGKTIKEVYEIDKGYLEYILHNTDMIIPKPKYTRQHIKNYLEHKENLEKLKDK